MGLIDSHAHLTFPELIDQVDDVLDRCTEVGVDRVITIGTTPADSKLAIELSEKHPERIHAAVGIHPHESPKAVEADLAAVAELWTHPTVVGVGEIGLDYHYDFADRTVQGRVFAGQLALAADRSLPLIIHCREAFDDTIRLLVDHSFLGRRVVFHCFTGTADQAGRVAEHGWSISFAGIVTFRKSTWLHEIARAYPADQLMIETDSPYLAPVPRRGKTPNEPAYLVHTARFLSELRQEPYETVAERTARNTRRFFDLG